MRFDEHFLRGALPDAIILHNSFPEHCTVSVDSRTVLPGNIFVPMIGSSCDGHAFIKEAFDKGAAGVIIARDKKEMLASLSQDFLSKKLVVMVHDTLTALVKLAATWRLQFSYPVVAITGSVGKTSTKNMLGSILTHNGTSILIAQGNQNTLIGAAINLLGMRAHHQVALLEVGISKRGEMAEIARMIQPTIGVITLIGHGHMEGLGSFVDIALEKRDLFKYFTDTTIGIINGDQPVIAKVGYTHPVIKFGLKTTNQIQARKVCVSDNKMTFVLKIYNKKHTITLPHTHVGSINNILAATAAAHLLGVADAVIVQAVHQLPVVSGRFERLPVVYNGSKSMLINDAYNANPESMKAALLAFQHMHSSARKIAVLGDMLGLGDNSPFWHRQLGRFLRKVPSLQRLILVGSMVKWTQKTLPLTLSVQNVPTWQDALDLLQNELAQESLVLIKGSNGVGLGNIVQNIVQKPV